MGTTLWRIAWRLALCGLVSWLAWRIASARWGMAGLVSVVATAPLYGILLAKPLLALASDLHHAGKALAWRDVQGRYFEYRGEPVGVIEDVEHVRWVRTADVRRIVGTTATDGMLALTYPDGCARLGPRSEPHLSDEALLLHLRKDPSPEALRFLQWVEQTIVFPARRLRAQARGADR